MSFDAVTRRVVTGHDAVGRSVVLSDAPAPIRRTIPDDGVAFTEIWQTSGTPTPIRAAEPSEPTDHELIVPPPTGGTRIRINEFLPGHLDDAGLQSPVHRTESIDYGIVLEGEIVLVLEESEVTLRTGDTVVQRGTSHAWANRSASVCRVAFILIDGTFAADLLDVLPADAHELVMRRGPRD